MKTYLYRFYNHKGALLYVGVSLSVTQRLAGHQGAGWFNQVSEMRVETFADRTTALKAEAAAIKSERPPYNVMHKPVFRVPLKQLCVELPEAEARRIKKDAVELGVTLNEYALRAFQAFLAKNKAQRGCHFAKRKIMGRKISLK